MKKLCIVILMFIICVPLVKAETEEELQQKLDNFLNEQFPNDTVELNSINPNNYNDSMTLEYYTDTTYSIPNEYCKDDIITTFAFEENYTKATIKASIQYDYYKTVEKTKEVNIKWKETNSNYKSKISDLIENYSNIVKTLNKEELNLTLLDIYTIKHYKDGGVIKLEELINDNKISYIFDLRAGDVPYDWKGSYARGFIYLFYDNILYGIVEGGFEPFNIIYIPQDTKETKEDYINAAQIRLNKYYPNLKLENSNKNFTGDEELNKYIDNNLNSSFNPVSVDINLKSKNYSFIIVKGTSTQLTSNIPSEFKNNYQSNNQNNNNPNNQSSNNQNNDPSNNQQSNNPSNDEIENPQTGSIIPIAFIIVILIVSVVLLIIFKNKKQLYKI